MNNGTPAYGLWSLVLLNSAIFIMFAFSFFKPQTARDWRTFGAFAAFVVALFVSLASCGAPQPVCSASMGSGCCQADGVCVPIPTANACGARGAAPR